MFSIFAGVLFLVTFIMLWFYLPAATKLKKHKVETGGEDLCCSSSSNSSLCVKKRTLIWGSIVQLIFVWVLLPSCICVYSRLLVTVI
jgi:hypothetical protein